MVALFTALPNALVITAETTEEEKDVIFAQLTAAMDAFDALTQEEQDTSPVPALERLTVNPAVTLS